MSGLDAFLEPVPGVEPTKGGIYLWRYSPSVAAAAIFLLLFMATFLLASWKTWKSHAWFCAVFCVGCFFEMVGYGVRAGAHSKTGKIMPFAVQNMFILISPALFAATIYMVLGRIITAVRAEKHCTIQPSKLTKTFVIGDVLSLLIQGGASGLMVVQQPGLAVWGERMVILGLAVQVVMFAVFCAIAVVFHRRMRRAPTPDSFDIGIPWKPTLYALYVMSILIMIRSIFRVIEYAAGQGGYPLSHEWTLYVFDSLLMFIVTILFVWKFPSELKPSKALGV